MKVLHTADWQIGKPFARIEDARKRALVQQERIDAIARLGALARDEQASLVLVAGDLFDSPTADKATVSAACSAIGGIGLPVVVIPGNHDHGGPGTIWKQDFFLREQREMAPLMTVLLENQPFECDDAVILPCPLQRQIESRDLTAWLREAELYASLPPGKPRIVLAHGSVAEFGAADDEDELFSGVSGRLDLDRLPMDELDYVALGDWHGTKQVTPKAWYSGTHEIDRFPRGEANRPGHVLLATVERGGVPDVKEFVTGRLGWQSLEHHFADDHGVEELEALLREHFGTRADQDLLQLRLTGSLGIEAADALERLLDTFSSRLLRLKLYDEVVTAPTGDELAELSGNLSDPLVAKVATRLVAMLSSGDESAEVAAAALRELYSAVQREGGDEAS